MPIRLLLPALVIVSQIVFAGPLVLKDDRNQSFTNFGGPYVEWFQDKSTSLTLADIQANAPFNPAPGNDVINLGFATGVYWFRIHIQNPEVKQSRILELSYPFHNRFNVYFEEKGKMVKHTGGDHLHFSKRWYPHKNFLFEIDFEKGEEKTIYIQLFCNGEASSFPVNLWTRYEYLQQTYFEQFALGLYYGIIVFALFLSVFLAFIARDISQVYYLFYILGIGLFQFSLDGFAFQFLWPGSVWLANHMIPVSGSIALFFLILFSRALLQIKANFSALNRMLIIMQVAIAVLFVLSVMPPPIFSWSLKGLNLMVILVNLIIFITAILAFRKRLRSSRYFLIAFSVLIFLAALSMLKNFGVLPRSFFTVYGIQAGSAFEVIMLSLALAESLKTLKSEKEKAQAQLLRELGEKFEIQKKAKEELEQKVVERTREISSQKELIEAKNKDITDSINYALRIQQAMMPPTEEMSQHLREMFLFYRPRDIVSGDFYWFSVKNNLILFAVADCTGHGVPGSLMSMIGSSFLNEIVNEYEITHPSDILDMLRYKIIKTLRQMENHSFDGMDISLCCIDPQKKTVGFAGAFNSAYLLANLSVAHGKVKETGTAASGKKLYILEADRFPVGYVEGRSTTQFNTITVPYTSGDCMILLTDGLADQFGGNRNKKFKPSRIKEFLLKQPMMNMREVSAQLESTFETWKQGNEQVDDVLVAGIVLP